MPGFCNQLICGDFHSLAITLYVDGQSGAGVVFDRFPNSRS
ncbi:MAG: hypothetical protein WA197_25005 [Candidatus Acidiferrales bacterium]